MRGQSRRLEPSALFTDLYELTMLQAYHAEGMASSATFELFYRRIPPGRRFVVAAGLDDALTFLEQLAFTDGDLEWLDTTGRFRSSFLESLRDFRFTGDVYAVPEGTVVYPHEPIIQVVAPLPEAQLIETYLLNQVHLQSVVASKAARVVLAAGNRRLVEFGSRRAHGTDAAHKVARVSHLLGFAGTSNVEAARRYDIPPVGTMAHSYIQAHGSEHDAFAAFSREFPETTLLVDTYDTMGGVRHVIDLARQLGDEFRVTAIRLDSGDLHELSTAARAMLDDAGLAGVQIFASGGLNEWRIAELVESGAPIDAFGVGSELAVSQDAPDLDLAYKLVEYAGRPTMKFAPGKANHAGRKQVFRRRSDGINERDVIGLWNEQIDGQPLLQPVMTGGRRVAAGAVSHDEARAHAATELQALPVEQRILELGDGTYPVDVTAAVEEVSRGVGEHELALG